MSLNDLQESVRLIRDKVDGNDTCYVIQQPWYAGADMPLRDVPGVLMSHRDSIEQLQNQVSDLNKLVYALCNLVDVTLIKVKDL
jgi:hypothetical protein